VLLGLIGVYMLLALQFRGYLVPVTVMLVIPTALIGVVFGHLALGLHLTMPSIVGMASLFGVVVNDSILLVVFIREARATGVPVSEAAKQAGRARFRPILLTSITTVAGLTPLLLEKSLQAQVLISARRQPGLRPGGRDDRRPVSEPSLLRRRLHCGHSSLTSSESEKSSIPNRWATFRARASIMGEMTRRRLALRPWRSS
jgi:hypothetical protein